MNNKYIINIYFQGTMISHDSITYGSAGNLDVNLWRKGAERVVSYLPLSHIAGNCVTTKTFHSYVFSLTSKSIVGLIQGFVKGEEVFSFCYFTSSFSFVYRPN